LNIEELMERIFARPKREHVKRETVNFEEDGNYYPMMNKLRVAISFGDFSAYEIKVLDYLVIRRFGTKYVVPTVTIPEMTDALRMDRNNMRKTVKGLCARGVIEVCGNLKNMPTYRICLVVQKWKMRCGDTSKGKELVNPAFIGGVRSLDTSIEAKNEVSGHPPMRYVDTSIDIEKDFKKKEREEEKENPGVSPQTPSSSEKIELDHSFPSDSFKEERALQEPQTPIEKDLTSEQKRREEPSPYDNWPLWLQEDRKKRLERQHKLSALKGPKKEGRWTDEELRATYGNDVDCQWIRERFESSISEQELKNLQIHFLRNLNKIPRKGR